LHLLLDEAEDEHTEVVENEEPETEQELRHELPKSPHPIASGK